MDPSPQVARDHILVRRELCSEVLISKVFVHHVGGPSSSVQLAPQQLDLGVGVHLLWGQLSPRWASRRHGGLEPRLQAGYTSPPPPV